MKVKKVRERDKFHYHLQGYNSWTQGLYGYSWDMMIHSWSTQHVVVKVTDKHSDREQYLRPGVSHFFFVEKFRDLNLRCFFSTKITILLEMYFYRFCLFDFREFF